MVKIGGLAAIVFLNANCLAIQEGDFAPMLTQSEAWEKLPQVTKGGNPNLPSWARILAASVPRSTAALLELDLAHRTQSPIAPRLRAGMRWVSANANRCEYARQVAELDARRAGVTHDHIAGLTKAEYPGWSASERRALEFAHLMTVDSEAIADEQFAQLVHDFGEKQAASMVLLMAYANMQDRLLQCLGVSLEIDRNADALSPVQVSFGPEAYIVERTHPPVTESTTLPKAIGKESNAVDPRWSELGYDTWQERLQSQREKTTRLPILSWDKIAPNIPSGMFSGPSDIIWYRTVFGYAPELAAPFERFMRTSGAETSGQYGRVLGTTLFWVTTQAVKCAYCMGHCEMNWEVAGLTLDEIAERSRTLAGDDWSRFSEPEQRALAFTRKLAQTPWEISSSDLGTLKQDFGADLALMIVLHTSRYHYMTRISNGFQLKLESENVFFKYWNKDRPQSTENSQAVAAQPEAKSFSLLDRAQQGAFVPLPSDSEAWGLLPSVVAGQQTSLPSWARAVALELPRTAAAMLQLDAAHRLRSPLEPQLRAKLRWIIAQANHCEYSKAYAIADLRRAGGDETAVNVLIGESSRWPAAEHDAFTFARLLTVAAPTISDGLFQRLREQYGDRKVAAMILLAAYGNFQDRIVLGLNLPMEVDGPLAPLDIVFVDGALQMAPLIPPNDGKARYVNGQASVVPLNEEWTSIAYEQLQARLEDQRHRAPRLPIPQWADVKSKLPTAMSASPTSIRWSLVNYGYAHELAIPWTIATRTHWSEAPADRILEESLFWVQTRQSNATIAWDIARCFWKLQGWIRHRLPSALGC